MKLKSAIIISAASLAFLGCEKHHTELPPGYTMSCDGNGNFAAVMPYGVFLDDYHGVFRSNLPYPSRQSAIDRAWDQYEYVPHQEHDAVRDNHLKLCNE